MKKLVTTLAALTIAGTSLIAFAPQADASDRTCRGTIANTTIGGNVYVPARATCTLTNVVVKGDVKVERAATLTTNRGYVDGNIQGEEGPRAITVNGTRVDGDIQTKYATGVVLVSGARVDGNIQHVESGIGRFLTNRVGGDIQVFKNRGEQRIQSNVVEGNLQCKENRPAPVGGRNTVYGNKEDQCRRL